MSGLSSTTSLGLGSIVSSSLITRMLQSALSTYTIASREVLNPPQSLPLLRLTRQLRSQRSHYEGIIEASSSNQERLSRLIDSFDSMTDSLSEIEDLIQDTITTPTNASVNQAAIDNLISAINSDIDDARGGVTNPTFFFENFDGRLSPLVIKRAAATLTDADGFDIDINVTTAATRGTRTNYVTNVTSATDVIQFTIDGPDGTSGTISIGATNAEIEDYITGLNAGNAMAVTFDLTGSLGTESITINAADTQANVMATINAVSGNTGIIAIAGTTGDAVTLQAIDGGSAEFITVMSTMDAGGETELAADQTVNGTEFTQSAAIALINSYTATTGVEAVVSGATNITLRTVLYGSDYTFSTSIVSDPDGHLAADASATGVDAAGTIVVGGVTSTFTGVGREVDFNVGGAEGTFSVTGNMTFNPAALTVRGGNFLPLITNNGLGSERINFNTLDYGYLGRTVSAGGLDDIDVTTDTATALDIISQAIEDLEVDQSFAEALKTGLVDAQIDNLTDRIASIEDRMADIEDLQDALNSFDILAAQTRLNTSVLLISQLSTLFPLTTTGLV